MLFLTAEDSKRHPLEKLHWLDFFLTQVRQGRCLAEGNGKERCIFPHFPTGFRNEIAILYLQEQPGQYLYLQTSATP